MRPAGHEKGIVCLKFSEGPTEGKYLASASADKTAKIWETSTGDLWHTLVGHAKVRFERSFQAQLDGFK